MPWPSLLGWDLKGGTSRGAAWAPRECLAWALAHLLVPAAALALFFLLHPANPVSA